MENYHPAPISATSSAVTERPKLFVSYSRQDSESFVDELVIALELVGLAVYSDRQDIAAGEDWRPRIQRLIFQSDTILFIISPAALESDVCKWELGESLALSKRLLPVLFKKPSHYATIPKELAGRQFIRFDEDRSFSRSLSTLVAAIRTDIEWLREHTRLAEQAARWHSAGRTPSLLLRSELLELVEVWRIKRKDTFPDLTTQILDFIQASKLAECASKERERLHTEQMENAREEAARLQKHSRRFRLIASLLFVVLAVVSVSIAGYVMRLEYAKRIANVCDLVAAEPDNEVHVPGVEFDKIEPSKAVPACEQAVRLDSDNPRLMHNLARSLDRAGSFRAAFEWYERAAERAFAPAENAIGVLYLYGRGTKTDLKKAIHYIRRASQSENADALINYTETDYSLLFDDNPTWASILESALVKKGVLSADRKEGRWNQHLIKAIDDYKTSIHLVNDHGLTLQVLDKLEVIDALADTIGRS